MCKEGGVSRISGDGETRKASRRLNLNLRHPEVSLRFSPLLGLGMRTGKKKGERDWEAGLDCHSVV